MNNKPKLYTELTVMDAVDNLSSMAELDIPESIETEKVSDQTHERFAGKLQLGNWLDPQLIGENKEVAIVSEEVFQPSSCFFSTGYWQLTTGNFLPPTGN